ncbi:uncharacterized protein BDZ99DRAFT_554024 [Mytilinidion resinicola]|uniref:Uncharacterized protein n=1 Tax=Mytilinidion resinicola TaxID=574789 RepID=A0A6A6YZT0_9PEZI|nr:uncharacterized protein BDZ99DRAFT_554024 [Mytilinidion resinicola]KAF2813953.1 hypothetical protein BDZ99DRAFT_554024 [Mytilinidion resinicola]
MARHRSWGSVCTDRGRGCERAAWPLRHPGPGRDNSGHSWSLVGSHAQGRPARISVAPARRLTRRPVLSGCPQAPLCPLRRRKLPGVTAVSVGDCQRSCFTPRSRVHGHEEPLARAGTRERTAVVVSIVKVLEPAHVTPRQQLAADTQLRSFAVHGCRSWHRHTSHSHFELRRLFKRRAAGTALLGNKDALPGASCSQRVATGGTAEGDADVRSEALFAGIINLQAVRIRGALEAI